jgi:hypothetical protein
MEDYAAKMALKPDAALREYVSKYVQYREAAVLAAFDELRRRGTPAPEEAALRPALEAAARSQRDAEAAEAQRQLEAAEKAHASDGAEETGPALYSPGTIMLFSVMVPLLSMITGGVLLGMNLFRLGKKRAVLGLAVFVIAYIFIGSYAVTWAMTRYGLAWLVLLFNLPAALAYILWFWPRYIGSTTTYRSRSILGPFLLFMAIMWGLNRLTPYLVKQQPKEVQQELERMMRR